MKVELIAYTQNAEAVCSAAGKSCYSENSSYDLMDSPDPAKVLSKIVGMGHHSVIEHAVFTFSIENPDEECPGRFALVKFSENGLFMYAVYVNIATGASDLEFFAVSGAYLLVAHDLLFPFLDQRESRYQKAIIARIKGNRP